MFNLNERTTNKLLSQRDSSNRSLTSKRKTLREGNSTRSNSFSLQTIQSYFEHCSRKQLKTCKLFNDLLFSPTKEKWISRLKDLVKLSKTKIHFQRLLVSLLNRFPLTLNITVKTFSLERFCCIIRLSSCQNTSSNWFAKNSGEHFSLLSLNFVIGENVKWETNTFLLLIAKIFSELCLCCYLSVVACQMKRCKDLQWDRSLFVSLLNESFVIKWKFICSCTRSDEHEKFESNPRQISTFSSVEGEFLFHQQIHIVSIEQLFQFKLRFRLFQAFFSSFVKVHLNNWKTNKDTLLSFLDYLFSQLIFTLKFTTLLLYHRSVLLTKTRKIILLIVAKIRSIEM